MMASELNDCAEAAERRETLEKFASANPDVPRGYMLGRADRVLIGRFRDPAFVRGLQKSLRQSKIPSTLKTSRFEAAVYVPESHRSDAFHVLSKWQHEHPPSTQKSKRLTRRYDLYFLYGLTSFISMSLYSYYHNSLRLWLSSLFACAAALWLFDRSQVSQQWYGRYRFSLLDMLIVFAVVAMLFAAINF